MSEQTTSQWDPQQYARHARFVSDLGMPIVDLLAPQPGERILDLGCGDGALTRKLAALGCDMLGVDSSPEMIQAAQALGLEAHVVSGHALTFRHEFDAVFSNAALHWMRPPEAVIAGVWQALKPGGRFVAECGGAGNIATVMAALEAALATRGIDAEPCNPWFFPRAEDYQSLLEQQGFLVHTMTLFARPTPLPGDMTEWLAIFAATYIAAVPKADQPAFVHEVRERCRPRLCDAAGQWTADYVRLRFAASKP